MEAFATVEDLEKRFRILDPQEKARAGELLYDASVMLDIEMRRRHVIMDMFDSVQTDNVKRIACDMVRRAMSRASENDPSMYAFGGNLVATASGELYLTGAERKSLGLSGHGRIGTMVPW